MTSLNNKLNKMVIPTILTGLSGLPTDYRTRINNFLREYLGTPDHPVPVPFGGRQEELTALDEWLYNPDAPPYALLAAEASRGKSALLVQWTQSLIADDLAHVVFVPVSIRFNTALATTFFTVLAARLGELYGEPVEWANLSAQQWREVCQSYLNRPWPHDNPLVIIVDGLDEAADWRAGPDLFPLHPPSGLRVVVSARYLAGDTDESGWRERLGWHDESQACRVPLPPLTIEGVCDILRQMGDPLEQLASSQVDIVQQLYRLCEDDPLLMRLYIDALLPYGDRTAAIRAEELASIKDGLADYFERWWQDQEEQWAKQGRDPLGERQEVLEFFNICAAALGPLTRHDIAMIAGGTTSTSSGQRLASEEHVKKVASQVERFIIGGTQRQGYTFSHSQLGDYFWERMEPAEQEAWNARFLEFGRHTLEALNNGTLEPQNAPPYAIQYYGAHLERTNAPTDAFYALVSSEWMRAWEVLEGTHAGFLNDVEYAWQRAEAERDMAMQIKCALCRASVAAHSTNIPPKLLALAVQHKHFTPIQGLVIVRQTAHEHRRSQALSKLAPHLPPELLGETLQIVRGIKDGQLLFEALWPFVPYLPDYLLAQALEIALTIDEEDYLRWLVLEALAPHLPDELLDDALEAVRRIDDERARTTALSAFACRLKTEALLGEALEGARTINHEDWRAYAFSALAPHLPKELLSEALEAARTINNEHSRAKALSALAPHLPKELLGEALEAARTINDEHSRANALKGLGEALEATPAINKPWKRPEALAPYIGDKLLGQRLQWARAIHDGQWRAIALSALAAHLPDELLGEAIEATRAIHHPEWFEHVLSELAPLLPEELLAQALEVVLAMDGWKRPNGLRALAPHLSDELLGEAVEVVLAMDGWMRCNGLRALAPHLPNEFLGKRFEVARAIKLARAVNNEHHRAKALKALAPDLPDELLGERLKAARAITNPWERAQALRGLGPHLPDELLGEALEVVRAINNPSERVQALEALAPHLPDELLGEALEVVLAMDGWERRNGLKALAPHFTDQLLGEALEVARAINDPSERADALTVLMPLKPDELLREVLEAEIKNYSYDFSLKLQSIADIWGTLDSVPHWLSTQPSAAYTAWAETIRYLSQIPRPEFLEQLYKLLPNTLTLAGEEADTVAVGIFHAIEEVGEWWP